MNAQTLPKVKMPNQSNFIVVYPLRGEVAVARSGHRALWPAHTAVRDAELDTRMQDCMIGARVVAEIGRLAKQR